MKSTKKYILYDLAFAEQHPELSAIDLLVYCRIKGFAEAYGMYNKPLSNIANSIHSTEQTARRTLRKLVELGLIEETRESGKTTAYRPLTNCNPLQIVTPYKLLPHPLQIVTPHLINNNINNNYRESINAPARELDFVAPEYKEVFDLWLQYKKERRETYKSERSMKAAYNRLLRLADNNVETAAAIVEQSIANNWAGLFELKESKKNGNISRQQEYSDAVNRAIVAGLFAQ